MRRWKLGFSSHNIHERRHPFLVFGVISTSKIASLFIFSQVPANAPWFYILWWERLHFNIRTEKIPLLLLPCSATVGEQTFIILWKFFSWLFNLQMHLQKSKWQRSVLLKILTSLLSMHVGALRKAMLFVLDGKACEDDALFSLNLLLQAGYDKTK